MRRLFIILVFGYVLADTADAQSLYVVGALGADISLASGARSSGFSTPTGGGEALSGAARLGTVLNDRFGIELEVSRAGEIKETSRTGPAPLPLGVVRPFFLPEIESRRRVTTVSTTASIRQQVSDTIALVYLGGIVFHRTDDRVEYKGLRGSPVFGDFVFNASGYTISGLSDIVPVGLVLPSLRNEAVRYGAGPVVGFEAHIGYGEHFLIVPGIRMHSLPASWLLRPSLGAGWSF